MITERFTIGELRALGPKRKRKIERRKSTPTERAEWDQETLALAAVACRIEAEERCEAEETKLIDQLIRRFRTGK